jgi:hypothetical protein
MVVDEQALIVDSSLIRFISRKEEPGAIDVQEATAEKDTIKVPNISLFALKFFHATCAVTDIFPIVSPGILV